jgi:hypothetical protein
MDFHRKPALTQILQSFGDFAAIDHGAPIHRTVRPHCFERLGHACEPHPAAGQSLPRRRHLPQAHHRRLRADCRVKQNHLGFGVHSRRTAACQHVFRTQDYPSLAQNFQGHSLGGIHNQNRGFRGGGFQEFRAAKGVFRHPVCNFSDRGASGGAGGHNAFWRCYGEFHRFDGGIGRGGRYRRIEILALSLESDALGFKF